MTDEERRAVFDRAFSESMASGFRYVLAAALTGGLATFALLLAAAVLR